MADEQFELSVGAGAARPLLHPEQPKLIVLEGIDLSGRTTQIHLLRDWLLAQRYHVTTTAWRTSPLISDVLARARTGLPLRPLTYSLLFCADHMDRTERVIKPALERGEIVLADRYTYTAFARDEARGLNKEWVRNLYCFTVKPDVVFYLHINPEEAVRRRVALQQQRASVLEEKPKKRAEKKQKKAQRSERSAMTIQLPSLTPEAMESFHDFEMKMYSQYQSMHKEFDFVVIEGSQSIDLVQATLRRAVMRLLLEL